MPCRCQCSIGRIPLFSVHFSLELPPTSSSIHYIIDYRCGMLTIFPRWTFCLPLMSSIIAFSWIGCVVHLCVSYTVWVGWFLYIWLEWVRSCWPCVVVFSQWLKHCYVPSCLVHSWILASTLVQPSSRWFTARASDLRYFWLKCVTDWTADRLADWLIDNSLFNNGSNNNSVPAMSKAFVEGLTFHECGY